MFEYTKDNHLKFDNGVSIGRCSRPTRTFKEECVEAAKDIASKTDQRIYVAYNHDISSQVMCLAFLEAKVKFTAVIPILSPNNFNLFSYAVAKDFLEGYGISYKSVKIDVLDYFTKFSPDIAEKYTLPSYKNILHIFAQKELDGRTYVLSDNMLSVVRKPTGTIKHVRVDSSVFTAGQELGEPSLQFATNTPFNYYVSNNLPCIPEFFAYTPELLSSLYLSEGARTFIEAKDFVEMEMFDRVIKPMLFKEHWPKVKGIPKYTGIEVIDEIDSFKSLTEHFRQHLIKQHNSATACIPYSELLDYLSNDGEVKTWAIADDDFLNLFKKR